MLKILLFDFEPFRIDGHHEVVARAAEDKQFVVRVGAHRLEHLAKRTVRLHAQLHRASERMPLDEQHAIRPPLHREMFLEPLPVLFEIRCWHKSCQRHQRSPFR